MQLFRSIFIIYNKFTKIYEYISLIINMRIQINSFEFTVIHRLHRLYIKILEDITLVSRTRLPKDFQRAE